MTSATPLYNQEPQGLYRDSDHKGLLPSLTSPKASLDSLVRVNVPFLFEIEDQGQTVRSFVLHLAPNSIIFRNAASVDLQYTMGGVIREHHAPHDMTIQMRGKSGIKFRIGTDRNGLVVFKDGKTLNEELLAFFDYYQRENARRSLLARQDPDRRTKKLSLIFRALDLRRHLYVEPLGPDFWTQTQATGGSRFGYDWTCSLRAYAPATPARPANLLGPLADAALWLAEQIDQINALVALGAQALENTRSDLDVLREPFAALQRTGSLMREAVSKAGDLALFPAVLIADALIVARQFAAALADLNLLGDTLSRTYFGAQGASSPNPGQQMGALADDAIRLGWIAASGRGLGPRQIQAAQARNDRPAPPSPPGSIVPEALPEALNPNPVFLATLAPGEDLQALALRTLGQRDLWGRIADLNGLPDAYHLASGAPLLAGVVLQIPAPRPIAPFADPNGDGSGEFGFDLRLSDDGDLVWEDNDLALAWGPRLLRQALGLRYKTPQGSCQSFPDYGLIPVLGEAGVDPGLLAAHFRAQTLQDPRVVEVGDLSALAEADRVTIEAQILTGRASVGVRATLPSAAPT